MSWRCDLGGIGVDDGLLVVEVAGDEVGEMTSAVLAKRSMFFGVLMLEFKPWTIVILLIPSHCMRKRSPS